jgi:hypothetical protein
VGVCSGGSAANVATYLARADVTLSLVMTAGAQTCRNEAASALRRPCGVARDAHAACDMLVGPAVAASLQIVLCAALLRPSLLIKRPHSPGSQLAAQ